MVKCPQSGEVDTCGDGLRVDLVGEGAQGERLVDRLIEADEQLQQALSTAAHPVSLIFSLEPPFASSTIPVTIDHSSRTIVLF